MMNEIEGEQISEEVKEDNTNIDEYMLNFGTGLNMDVGFVQPDADLGIGSDGLNLFEELRI